ncbi:hypothetical protein [Rhizobium johnstonii]|uniref:hypothetical protein n=1 Tax=Rhizobium johnstonii TaxID=3019933 RepID=UPI003F9B91C3
MVARVARVELVVGVVTPATATLRLVAETAARVAQVATAATEAEAGQEGRAGTAARSLKLSRREGMIPSQSILFEAGKEPLAAWEESLAILATVEMGAILGTVGVGTAAS